MTDNIIPIKSRTLQPNDSLMLAEVKSLLDSWRKNKKTRNEKIHPNVWDSIFHLLKTSVAAESKTLASLSITRAQYEQEKKIRQSTNVSAIRPKQTSEQSVEFCQAQQADNSPTFPLVSKPAKAFSTATCVVELYRPDGMLMKIHICTDRFDELLAAFYNGCQKT